MSLDDLSSAELVGASEALCRLGTSPNYAHEALIALVRERGPIKTVRVSSAGARGRTNKYPYWEAALYEVRVVGGQLSNVVERGASSDRRSYRLAELDAQRTGRIRVQRIGRLMNDDCAAILVQLEAWRV